MSGTPPLPRANQKSAVQMPLGLRRLASLAWMKSATKMTSETTQMKIAANIRPSMRGLNLVRLRPEVKRTTPAAPRMKTKAMSWTRVIIWPRNMTPRMSEKTGAV